MTDHRNDGPPMTEARLRDIIASYGASPQRWPADERVQALALLARSDAAQTHYDTAVRLDADLALLQPPDPSDALARRIAGLMPEAAVGSEIATHRRLSIRRVAGIAASLILAFALGLVLPSPLRDAPVTPTSVAVADPPSADAGALSDTVTLADLALIDLADDDTVTTSDSERLAAIPLE